MSLSDIFTNLGIPSQCLTNPDLCQISYIANVSNKNTCCINNTCPSASINTINLFDLFSSIQDDKNLMIKNFTLCADENYVRIYEGKGCPAGYNFYFPDFKNCVSIDYSSCLKINNKNFCDIKSIRNGGSEENCYLFYNSNNGMIDKSESIYYTSSCNPFGIYIDDGSMPSLNSPTIRVGIDALKNLLMMKLNQEE
jgi:hypothetical protein